MAINETVKATADFSSVEKALIKVTRSWENLAKAHERVNNVSKTYVAKLNKIVASLERQSKKIDTAVSTLQKYIDKIGKVGAAESKASNSIAKANKSISDQQLKSKKASKSKEELALAAEKAAKKEKLLKDEATKANADLVKQGLVANKTAKSKKDLMNAAHEAALKENALRDKAAKANAELVKQGLVSGKTAKSKKDLMNAAHEAALKENALRDKAARANAELERQGLISKKAAKGKEELRAAADKLAKREKQLQINAAWANYEIERQGLGSKKTAKTKEELRAAAEKAAWAEKKLKDEAAKTNADLVKQGLVSDKTAKSKKDLMNAAHEAALKENVLRDKAKATNAELVRQGLASNKTAKSKKDLMNAAHEAALKENALRDKAKAATLALERQGIKTRVATKSKTQLAIAALRAAGGETRLEAATKKATTATNSLTVSWSSMVRFMTTHITYRLVFGLIRGLQDGTAEAIALGKAIAEVRTISQQNASSTNEWLSSLRGLSDSFGLDILDQTEAAYQALSNQVANSREEVVNFLNVANKFAITAKTSTATSVNLLTAGINAFGLRADEAEEYAANLFKTIELGRIRAEELESTIGRVNILASQLGVSYQEVNAALSSITIQGVKSSEAMTQIRGIFLKLIKPTKEMNKLFFELGIDSAETGIKVYGFTGLMEILREKTKGSTTELAKYISRIRGISGALALTGDKLRRFNAIMEESGDAQEAFAAAFGLSIREESKRLEVALTRIKNYFTEDLGRGLLEFFYEATDGFKKLEEVGIQFVLLLKGIGDFATLVNNAAKAVGGLKTVVAGLAAVFFTLNFNPFGLVLTGLALLTAKILEHRAHIQKLTKDEYKKWEEASRKVRLEQDKLFTKDINTATKNLEKLTGSYTKLYVSATKDANEHLKKNKAWYKELSKAAKTSIDTVRQRNESLFSEAEELLRRSESNVKNARKNIAKIGEGYDKKIFDFNLQDLEVDEQISSITTKIQQLKNEASGIQFYDKFEPALANIVGYTDQLLQLENQRYKKDRELFKSSNEYQSLLRSQMSDQRELAKIRSDLAKDIAAGAPSYLIEEGRQKEYEILTKIRDEQNELYKEHGLSADAQSKYNDLKKFEEEQTKRILEIEKERVKNSIALVNLKAAHKEITEFDYNELLLSNKLIPKETYETIKKNLLKAYDTIATEGKKFNINVFGTQKKAEEELLKLKSVFAAKEKQQRNLRGVEETREFHNNQKQILDERVKAFEIAQETVRKLTAQTFKDTGFENFLKVVKRNYAVLKDELYNQSEIKSVEKTLQLITQFENAPTDAAKKVLLDNLKTFDADLKGSVDKLVKDHPKLGTIFESNSVKIANSTGYLNGSIQQLMKSLEYINISDQFKEASLQAEQLRGNVTKFNTDLLNNKTGDQLRGKLIEEGLLEVTQDEGYTKRLEAQRIAFEKFNAEQARVQSEALENYRNSQIYFDNINRSVTTLVNKFSTFTNNLQLLNLNIQRASNSLTLNPTTYKAAGGFVPKGTDTIPAMLSPGEFVVNARATRRFYGQLLAMNNSVPRFADGGPVTTNNSTTVGDIHISANERMNVIELGNQLRREIRRGTIRL